MRCCPDSGKCQWHIAWWSTVIQPCNAIHQFQLQQTLIFLNCYHHHHLGMILQRPVQLSSSNQPVPCPQQLTLHLNFTQHQIWCHHTCHFIYQTTWSPKLSQKEHLWRQWDLSNRELMAWRGRMQWRTTKQILNMFSQLTLKDMEPETGHKADCHQEIKEQQSAQKWLFPGGWGQVVTSDIFIDTLATIEAKGVAKAVQKAQKEEKAALHVMWEASKQKWQRKRESLKSHGLKMELAGPKPQLKDMKLPGANTCNHWLWCLLLHQLQKHNLLLTEGHC